MAFTDTKSVEEPSRLLSPAASDVVIRRPSASEAVTAPYTHKKALPWRMNALLIAGDTLALGLLVYILHVLSIWMAPAFATNLVTTAPVVIGGALAFYAVMGLYRVTVMHPVEELRTFFNVIAGVALMSPIVTYLLTGDIAAAAVVAVGGILAMIALPVARIATRIMGAYLPWWGVPAVVIGPEDEAECVVDTMQRWPEIGLRPVSVCKPATRGASVTSHEALSWAKKHDVPYAILTRGDTDPEQRARLFAHYSQFFEHVFCVPATEGMVATWTTTPTCKGLYGFGVRHLQHQPVARFLKRLIDVVGATILLFMLAPVFLIISSAIKWNSSGSVFYQQTRMGYQGEMFTVLKFRTMYADADARLETLLAEDPVCKAEYEQYHKLQDDPRVTSIGQWLRRYSLDELPQLFNVLRGDMSLVGPRAYMPKELFEMRGLSRVVLQTPPGITGLWQVSGRNDVSFSGRIDLDVHYVHNWSLWLDLYLLARTLPVVCSGSGAH